jgi:hypothetical protein
MTTGGGAGLNAGLAYLNLNRDQRHFLGNGFVQSGFDMLVQRSVTHTLHGIMKADQHLNEPTFFLMLNVDQFRTLKSSALRSPTRVTNCTMKNTH